MTRADDKFLKLKQELEGHGLGAHLCSIYRDKSEQFSLVIPYISIGLERNERCLYIIDENSSDEVVEAFKVCGIQIDDFIKNGQFQILTKEDAYLKDGYFDPDRMIETLKSVEKESLDMGYRGLRVAGEMTWIFSKLPGVERLIEYETKLNYFFPGSKSTAVCQYNETRFPPDLLLDMIHAHPQIIVDNSVCKNTFYIPPDEFLARKKGKITRELYEKIRDDIIERSDLVSHEETLKKSISDSEKKFKMAFEDLQLKEQQLIQAGKLSGIGQMAAGVAHEINNPLTLILGYAQLMLARKDLDENFKDDLLNIERESKRCTGIIENLLNFARPSKPYMVKTDINNILDTTTSIVEYSIRRENIEIEIKYGSDIPQVFADFNQLQQVFMNIIVNAVHAMPSGGNLTISTSVARRSSLVAREGGNYVVVSFTDTGVGIPDDNKGRIFDPFFTTSYQGGQKGTGLGLSISHSIIKEHGGYIEVESEIGKGSTFCVYLPVESGG